MTILGVEKVVGEVCSCWGVLVFMMNDEFWMSNLLRVISGHRWH